MIWYDMCLYIELTCIDMIDIYCYVYIYIYAILIVVFGVVLQWGNGGKPLDAGVPFFWTHPCESTNTRCVFFLDITMCVSPFCWEVFSGDSLIFGLVLVNHLKMFVMLVGVCVAEMGTQEGFICSATFGWIRPRRRGSSCKEKPLGQYYYPLVI